MFSKIFLIACIISAALSSVSLAAINMDATFLSGASPSHFGFAGGGTSPPASHVSAGVWNNTQAAGGYGYWIGGAAATAAVTGPLFYGYAEITVTQFGTTNDDVTVIAHGQSYTPTGQSTGGLLYFLNGNMRLLVPTIASTDIPVANTDGQKHTYGYEYDLLNRKIKVFFDGRPVGDRRGYAAGISLFNNDFYFGDGTGGAAHGDLWDRVVIAEGAYPVTPRPAQSLSRGHRILLERGLQLQALSSLAEGTEMFNTGRWAQSNFTAIDFVSYAYPASLMPPGTQNLPWSRHMYYQTDVAEADYPYLPSLVRIQLRDEQDIGDPWELDQIKATIAALRAQPKFDNVIIHTNQSGDTGSYQSFTTQQLQHYMAYARPDMLMFDRYPFNGGDATSGGYYQTLEKYRKLGLAGHDGSGAQPIPVGTYTQTFTYSGLLNHVVSESEIRLNNFAAWAFGLKLVDSYFYEQRDNAEESILFTGDGVSNPTPLFYQVAETNRQSLNLGPALVRLISTDARMKVGRHVEGGATSNPLPVGVSPWEPGIDPYIADIQATNLGSANNGLEGDVIVGYFMPLDVSFTNPGYGDDIYFMVVNGLTDPSGSAAACRQRIRIDFDFGNSGIDSLLRLSRQTGQVEEVALVKDIGTLYHLDLLLDGGTGDLFKFNNGGAFVGFSDLNGDGFVGQDDLNLILGNWGMLVTAGSITMGDPSGDGFVGQDDLNDVLGAWGQGTPPGFSATTPVPEPQALLVMMSGVVLLSVCRMRRMRSRIEEQKVSGTVD